MSDQQNGLIEIVTGVVIALVTWFLTPKTRAKIKAKLSRPLSGLSSQAKIKAMILLATKNPTSAAMVFGQFMHESANGTSQIFLKQNNLFGMKHPRSRPNLSVDSQRGHAVFGSHSDSIDDLMLWFENSQIDLDKIGNIDAYVSLLKSKSYFEDSYENYLRGVKAGAAKYFEF